MTHTINAGLARVLVGVIRLYQWTVSPLLAGLFGTSCRFTPSCSEYALGALRTHGAARGTWLALRRIGRCQPFALAGYDPVPAGPAPPIHPRLPYVPNPQE